MAAPNLGKALKEKMQRGQTVYCTFFQYTVNPALVDVLPDDALDFVIVTAEHNALDLAEFLPVRYALAAKGIACLARTHSREPDDVCDSFDGVIVPSVEDVEHARRLAAAAVYRPLKGQALERVLAEGKWPSEKTRKYAIKERCANTVFVPMIESILQTRANGTHDQTRLAVRGLLQRQSIASRVAGAVLRSTPQTLTNQKQAKLSATSVRSHLGE